MLELVDLSRSYGPTVALDGRSLQAPEGRLLGFVGPNGAGKTTAMRIGLGILEPDAGEVRWPGHPVRREEQRGFGYMPEERGLYPKMRADRQLRYLAELHGQSPRDAAVAVQRWSERLRRRLDQPAGRGRGDRVGRRRDRLRAPPGPDRGRVRRSRGHAPLPR